MEIRWPWKKAKVEGNLVKVEPPEVYLSDADRVTNYFASGGEIVDLSNKERLPNDGFVSDHELMTPWNQAHRGTKEGIRSLVARNKR